MKKIYWIIALVALTFVGDRVGGFILQKLTEQSQFRYSRLYKGEAKSDILLVGNSRGLMFYQPYIEDLTGKETFNISYNGMPMNLGRVLVEDYLERYEAPQLMILDITMCDRNNDGLIAGFNAYSSFSDRMKTLVKATNPTVGNAGMVSHLYCYNGEIFQRALYYLGKSDEDWLLDRVITDDLVNTVEECEPYDIDVPENIFEDFKATVALAQSKGVKVELVINPYYPPFAEKITNLEAIKKKFGEAVGLEVHDYSSAITDVEGFGDYQHLNKRGSRAFLDLLNQDNILQTKSVGEVIQ